MKVPSQKPPIVLPVNRLEDCLKQLKAAGATPNQMIVGILAFSAPSILRSLVVSGMLWAAYFGTR